MRRRRSRLEFALGLASGGATPPLLDGERRRNGLGLRRGRRQPEPELGFRLGHGWPVGQLSAEGWRGRMEVGNGVGVRLCELGTPGANDAE
jgi:hypothetical protein